MFLVTGTVYVPGVAICKSLHPDIAECMGVSMTEVTMGLVRLLFVKCPAVQMDAAHLLCGLLGKFMLNHGHKGVKYNILGKKPCRLCDTIATANAASIHP